MSFETDNIEKIKSRLKDYSEKDIKFNEPHFSDRLLLRDGSKEEVIKHLLDPSDLVYSYSEIDKYGSRRHVLHFKISNTRTVRLPMIFDKKGKKGLYIITYILRYRNWRNMVR